MEVAFELRAAAKKRFAGGSFALPGGETFDIGKRLKAGKGRIVTDDVFAIDRLRQIPDLKEVSAKSSTAKKRKTGGAKSAPTATSTNGGES
jgi:hypothetical protein